MVDTEYSGTMVQVPGLLKRLLSSGVVLLAFAHHAGAHGACQATDHGSEGGDNVAALTRTLAECAGQTIHNVGGAYVYSPAGFATGIARSAGTTPLGDGSQGLQPTVLKIAGAGISSLCCGSGTFPTSPSAAYDLRDPNMRADVHAVSTTATPSMYSQIRAKARA
jgi:hypothetical protein